MILIDNTCISDDVAEKFFVCNLDKCKGACCVEGDMGAPLEGDEPAILDRIYDDVKPYLSPCKAFRLLNKKGDTNPMAWGVL